MRKPISKLLKKEKIFISSLLIAVLSLYSLSGLAELTGMFVGTSTGFNVCVKAT